MSTFIDFFTLRPMFTAFGLKVVWSCIHKFSRSDIHFSFWDFSGVGAAGHRYGSVAAERHPFGTLTGVTAHCSAATFGDRKHYHCLMEKRLIGASAPRFVQIAELNFG